MACTAAAAGSSASTIPRTGATSLTIAGVKPSFSRAFNIDAPWHPTAPETMIASPGRAAPQEISIPSISSPTPR